MKQPPCPRVWEAEAARDGRLSALEEQSFERHRGSCAICREAEQALARLGSALQSGAPDLDELASRRLRHQLLRSADEALKAAPANRQRRAAALGAIAVALLALVAGSSSVWTHRSVSTPTAAAPPAQTAAPTLETAAFDDVVIHAEPGAAWTRRQSAGLDEINLSDGTLSVEVHHPDPAPGHAVAPRSTEPSGAFPRVRVHVPEGLILDVGTRFRIVVERRRTVAIQVSEGAVVFQRPGLADVRVNEGSAWSAAADPATEARTDVPPSNGTAASIPSAPREPTAAAASNPGRVPLRSPRDGSAPAEVTSGPDSRVSPEHDREGTEDAAYLRWISLLRAGRHAEARGVGLDYLRRFPNGFRRAEVESSVAPLGPRHSEPASKPQ